MPREATNILFDLLYALRKEAAELRTQGAYQIGELQKKIDGIALTLELLDKEGNG